LRYTTAEPHSFNRINKNSVIPKNVSQHYSSSELGFGYHHKAAKYVQNRLNILFYLRSSHCCSVFSENDVALVIKYHFHDSAEIQSGHETKNKKRKVFQTTKRNSIKDYSYIKLPAPMFAHYLEFDCQNFINDCLRYLKISPGLPVDALTLNDAQFLCFFSLKQRRENLMSTIRNA